MPDVERDPGWYYERAYITENHRIGVMLSLIATFERRAGAYEG
jgi:hypothetical protein